MKKIISLKKARAKGLIRYFTGIPCKRKHKSERLTSTRGCLECQKIHEKKYSSSKHGKIKRRLKGRRYRKKNIIKIRKRERELSKTPKYRAYARKYNQRDYVIKKRKLYNQSYRKKNLDRLLEKDRLYAKNVKRKDPNHLIKELCRRRILIALESQDATKSESLKKLMGCSIQTFKKNLEKQFYPHPKTGTKMSWKNHGLKGWHIDHKIPLNNFNLKKVSEQRKAFNFKNTQPMWSFQNLSKGHRG